MHRTTTVALGALFLLVASPLLSVGSAQAQAYGHARRRPAQPVGELSEGALSSLLVSQRGAVSGCASRSDTGAFLAEVTAHVAPGSRPATMFNSRIRVQVRSRPRDGEFESCVRRQITDSLRHQAYAVGPRAVRARHTFQIAERREPPLPRPPPAFSEGAVQSLLRAHHGRLASCVEVVGVPEQVTLRVVVEADGRLTLTNANLPGGASQNALPCLARTVSSLRVASRPARRVQVVHQLALRR